MTRPRRDGRKTERGAGIQQVVYKRGGGRKSRDWR